ncbi:MAG: type II toxin-antitoxin system HicA family toxin [Candidatus Omnitrophica bacterium]|nr:type II toxin-antitoxin system HicA family toxin [Candidatus Omnitrophota bacterium]
MSKLRIIDAKKMEKLLLRAGFERIRQKGSHVFYRHSDGRTTTVPHHGARVLARPLINEILREIEILLANHKQYTISKPQSSKTKLEFWLFGVVYCLWFGAWSLGFGSSECHAQGFRLQPVGVPGADGADQIVPAQRDPAGKCSRHRGTGSRLRCQEGAVLRAQGSCPAGERVGKL